MKGSKRTGPKAVSGSEDARRRAIAVLTVIAGLRTTAEVCSTLGISPMRYYVLETRGLQALVEAMEPLPRGRPRGAMEIQRLMKQLEQAQRESARWQALYRSTERTMGLSPKKAKAGDAKGGRRARRARVRAKGLIRALESAASGPSAAASEETSVASVAAGAEG